MQNNADGGDAAPPLLIDVPKLFSFAQNIGYLTRSSAECMYRVQEGKVYKAVSVGGNAVVIEVNSDDDGQALAVRFLRDKDGFEPTIRAETERYVREWFDLDRDMTPFYELAKADPLLRSVVERYSGLRIVGIPDLFEAIAWGIIGQQINLAFAYTLKRRLVESFGRKTECGGEPYWLFPEADTIASLTVEELLPLRMSVKKCEYLIHAARLIADGTLTKQRLLAAGGLQEAERQLVGIRGIGPWTANYVLMRCLRMPSAFPIDDVGLHNAVKHALNLDRKPTKAELLQLAEGWRGWEAYATFYLWRLLY